MGFNRKLFEIVVYPESFPMETLEEILGRSAIVNYAYAVHDSCKGDDGSLLKAHAHIMIRTKDSRNSEFVAKWFGVSESQVEKVKGRFADALKYLTHENAPTKYQYPRDIVVSNFDWTTEADKKSVREQVDEYVEKILTGDIREFDYHLHIPGLLCVNHAVKFKTAFEHRKQKIRGVNRVMNGIYITGKSGAGKTTLAKFIAAEKGYSTFISSGSNDILDGYQGQDCIILDDLRGSSLGLSDLLKMLDNNTASSVKSRYSNKVLECKLVIITSLLTLEQLFHLVFEKEKETIVQLQRRCRTKIYVERDYFYMSQWIDKEERYTEHVKVPNIAMIALDLVDLTESEQINKMIEVTGITHEALIKARDAKRESKPQDMFPDGLGKQGQ